MCLGAILYLVGLDSHFDGVIDNALDGDEDLHLPILTVAAGV